MSKPFRIFVVEDSETQAFKLQLLLEEQGWEVLVAGTAEAALTALGEQLPDLILVDYHLPGMRGDEFCRRMRINLNTRGIPILMMTGSGPGAAEISSLESGADDYISKSQGPEILLLRIGALLRTLPEQAAPILHPNDSRFRRARILIIDDSPTFLAFVSEELSRLDYEVDCVMTGAEGLALVATRPFDCVMVDLNMAEMNGFDVCRQITLRRSSRDSPPAVMILTNSDQKEDMNRGFEAGADDFVSKSSDLAVLRARIQALMRRRFFQEENERIIEELKARELETLQARAGREIAESRAAMAEELVQAHRELLEANRKLEDTRAQLIQKEKLASLGQLVAGIAHEINNPMAFVLNNFFIVETSLDALLPEMEPVLAPPSFAKLQKTKLRLGEMREGLERVRDIVRDLRTFSRQDEGEFQTVDVAETIDTVLLLLKHTMNGRIVVEKHYAEANTLSCYAGRLHQVFMNLVGNAVDAIAGDGKIIITTSRDSEWFRIAVRDSGPGIPEAIRGKIFDPFFTTKPVGKGTGLGLAISYGIVADHGGTIEVESQQGVGTEFLVRIPLDLKSQRDK